MLEFTRSQTTNDGTRTNNGIGFFSGKDDKERNWVGHSGGSVGGTSRLLIYPEQDIAIVTLVNLSSAQMAKPFAPKSSRCSFEAGSTLCFDLNGT